MRGMGENSLFLHFSIIRIPINEYCWGRISFINFALHLKNNINIYKQ